jgi:deubiquitinase DESI2
VVTQSLPPVSSSAALRAARTAVRVPDCALVAAVCGAHCSVLHGRLMAQRAFRGSLVELAVYDLTPANDCLATIGFGLHHTGVRIGGQEYTFSNDGVFSHTPGEVAQEGVRLRAVLPLGQLTIDSKAVDDMISELRGKSFPAGSYHLVLQNCNHFAAALAGSLGYSVPGWVNRLAWWGSWFPYWPPMGGDGPGPAGTPATPVGPTFKAFVGEGQTLGNTGSGATGGGQGMSQREQMAAAAQARLARMEQAAESGGDKKTD